MTFLSEFHEAGNYSEGSVYDAYEHAKYKEAEEREKELGSAVDHLRNIIQKLDRVFLVEPNKKLEAQLNKQKQNAASLVREVAERAASYADIIIQIDHFKAGAGSLDQTNYIKEFTAYDQKRTQRHDALLSAVNSANRYINQHFGNLTETDLDNFIEKEEEAGREVLDVGRVQLPQNGICPNGVNLNDRTSVGQWALQLGNELSAYKKTGRDIFSKKK